MAVVRFLQPVVLAGCEHHFPTEMYYGAGATVTVDDWKIAGRRRPSEKDMIVISGGDETSEVPTVDPGPPPPAPADETVPSKSAGFADASLDVPTDTGPKITRRRAPNIIPGGSI